MSHELFERARQTSIIRLLRELPWLMGPYHYLLAAFAAWWYRYPSEKMTVIGVTGTKGKTSTANLIAHLLENGGRKTGLATTVNFAIGEKQWANETKQTMLGRFALQRLLREMVDAGCRYAVVETSSEGILQYRHRFIGYDVVVFTNISPEHIERHGSFEKYREAKVRLFAQAARNRESIGVYNLNDANVEYFLEPPVTARYGFYRKDKSDPAALVQTYRVTAFEVSNVELRINKTKFRLGKDDFEMPLVGEFNVENAASAICVGLVLDMPLAKIKNGLLTARPIAGRFEVVNLGQPFTVIVDYAHEPASLDAVYRAAGLFKPRSVIGLLGAQGGGRDRWKRPVMGRIAAKYCDQIVLTNEDPYDEDPMQIIEDVKEGIYANSKEFKPVYKILDRREAIYKALSLAKKGDAVVLTGKGGELWMCLEGGRKIVWNEREIVEQTINEHGDQFLTRSGRNVRYEEN